MVTPDKHVRKYFSDTLTGLTVNGRVIPISDSNIPTNSGAYILMTTIDKSNVQETKCSRLWRLAINIDIVTVYAGNSGSRVLAEDIENAVLNMCQNITVNGFFVQGVNVDFAPDLSSATPTQTIFRKIIIYNLKLKENG